jgi:Peptidase S24-like
MRLRPWRQPTVRRESLARADVVGAMVRSTIEREGQATWRARGDSMLGAIRDGDVVTLVAPERGAVVPGAVVMAVLPDDRLVVHRVRSVRGGAVVLRGDACRRSDPPVSIDRVVAIVHPTPRPTVRALAYSLVS